MNIPLVDLKAQYSTIRGDIESAISGVLEEMQLYLGPNARALEEEFASYCGAGYGISVGSGTEALLFSLLGLGIGQGDEVITSGHTFVATIEAIIQAGAEPVLVDIDPDTYNIDVNAVERAISHRTKAIIPVHLYGQPCDMEPLRNIAQSHGIAIVEDACQAHGAEYREQRVGSLGDCACFSFYYSKNLGAYGEGGMVVTNDEKLAERIGRIRNHGQDARYSHSELGYNGRLDEIQAAILRIKLRHLDEWNKRRRENASLYNQLLSELPLELPIEAEGARHVYHLYVIRSPHRDRIIEMLANDGIGTGVHYPIPVHRMLAFQGQSFANCSLPNTEAVAKEIVSLPMYPELTERQIRRVVNSISSALNGRTR